MALCAKHHNETLLTCGKCGEPICPDCTVFSPGGIRCRKCAALRMSPIYQVANSQVMVAAFAGFCAASVGAYLLLMLRGLGFVIMLAGLGVGSLVGEVVLRCVERRRGEKVDVTAAACCVVGFLAAFAARYGEFILGWRPALLAMVHNADVYLLVMVGAMVFGAIGRVRSV